MEIISRLVAEGAIDFIEAIELLKEDPQPIDFIPMPWQSPPQPTTPWPSNPLPQSPWTQPLNPSPWTNPLPYPSNPIYVGTPVDNNVSVMYSKN